MLLLDNSMADGNLLAEAMVTQKRHHALSEDPPQTILNVSHDASQKKTFLCFNANLVGKFNFSNILSLYIWPIT